MFSCYYYCGRGVHLHTVTRDQQPQDINMFQSSWRPAPLLVLCRYQFLLWLIWTVINEHKMGAVRRNKAEKPSTSTKCHRAQFS